MDAVSQVSDGVRINVRLTPRASRDEIVGTREGALVVRVTAPPAENRANEALCRLIARRLGVAKGKVTLAIGGKARDKVVEVQGARAPEVRAKLGLQPR